MKVKINTIYEKYGSDYNTRVPISIFSRNDIEYVTYHSYIGEGTFGPDTCQSSTFIKQYRCTDKHYNPLEQQQGK